MPLNAKLHIETALRQGKTILKKGFCTQPFKIANITEDKSRSELCLMLMSSSPGILDGDCYDMRIEVAEGCVLSVETQSYQRLFQMKGGATQKMEVYLGDGSTLRYLPHPVVPHRDAIFKAKTKIFLSTCCTLLWGEVISCGRKLNGEMFRFSSLHSITEIYRQGKLVIKENLLLKPGMIDMQAIGQLEGYSHQATLIYVDEKAAIPSLTEEVVALLDVHDTITFGVTALPVNGLLVRILGYKAEQLFLLLKQTALLLQAKHTETKTTEPHVL